MPTGYTAIIGEKDDLTFNEFALGCARGMAALIHMRDDRNDAPIRKAVASDYHVKHLAETRQRIAAIHTMTEDCMDIAVRTEYDNALARLRKSIEEGTALWNRYERMEAMVRAWVPPTPDHEGFKAFMLEQLSESKRFDCYYADREHTKNATPTLKSGREWYSEQMADLISDEAYHIGEHRKEVERTDGRNTWIDDLFKSLGLEGPK